MKEIHDELATYGYKVVNISDTTLIDDLESFYVENRLNLTDGFHTTHFSLDTLYKAKVDTYLRDKLTPFVHFYLGDYKPVFANFMVKNSGGNNPMPLHADWTYVNEMEHRSFAIWINLCDTSHSNGCIGVIPYSNHLSNAIRGPRILQWNYPTNEQLIKSMGKLLPMKKGQALIYDHRLLHFSSENNSSAERPAINISVVPTDANVIHYCKPEGQSNVLGYLADHEQFFVEYNHFQFPKYGTRFVTFGKDIETIDQKAEDFILKYGNKNNENGRVKEESTFISRLKKFILNRKNA